MIAFVAAFATKRRHSGDPRNGVLPKQADDYLFGLNLHVQRSANGKWRSTRCAASTSPKVSHCPIDVRLFFASAFLLSRVLFESHFVSLPVMAPSFIRVQSIFGPICLILFKAIYMGLAGPFGKRQSEMVAALPLLRQPLPKCIPARSATACNARPS